MQREDGELVVRAEAAGRCWICYRPIVPGDLIVNYEDDLGWVHDPCSV
jgi:hypothetical protein